LVDVRGLENRSGMNKIADVGRPRARGLMDC
jgi:hypothetical protein